MSQSGSPTGIRTLAVVLVLLTAALVFLPAASAGAAECTSCHAAGGLGPDGSAHPVPAQPSWDPSDGQCTICHELNSTVYPEYQLAPFGPYWITDTGTSNRAGYGDHQYIWQEQCWSCHNVVHGKTFGPGTPLSGTINIAGSDCTGCHTSGMSVEVPQVGDGHPDLTEAHADVVTSRCASCHGSDLTDLHDDCYSCHASTLAAGTTCVTCHPGYDDPHGASGVWGSQDYYAWTTVSHGTMLGDVGANPSNPGVHANYLANTAKCGICHSVHRARAGGIKLLNTAVATCAGCHKAGSSTVTDKVISWEAEGPHASGVDASCTSRACHVNNPHGVGVSGYALLGGKLITSGADAVIGEALSRGTDVERGFNATDLQRTVGDHALDAGQKSALVAGYTCNQTDCHFNTTLAVLVRNWAEERDAQYPLGEGVTVDKTGHLTWASADSARDSYSPVTSCTSCHDQTDDSTGSGSTFPHSQTPFGTSNMGAGRAYLWMGYAGAKGDALTAMGEGDKAFDGACLKCHRDTGGFEGIGVTLDVIPPTTTSNAIATYTASATITLTATDNASGSGVAATHYTLNGGPQQSGTTVSVGTPGSYTLVFWSVDARGNIESPAKTAEFTVLPGPTATLAFVWHPAGYATARLHVESASGVTIAGPMDLSGSGADLDWYVTVPAGQNYRMVCDDWYEEDEDANGGGYSVWSNDPVDNNGNALNPDGVLSTGETVTWLY